jgi:uncharacterized MAPEG superfamily protein
MNNLTEVFSQVSAYNCALIALAVLCLAILIQSFLAGVLGLGKSDEEPGRPLKGSHQDFTFRTLRTYANSVENLPVFATTVFLAIIVNASPGWVNWLASIHVVLRLAFWAVYYSGVGAVAGGPRTITFVLGWLTNLILVIVVLVALF